MLHRQRRQRPDTFGYDIVRSKRLRGGIRQAVFREWNKKQRLRFIVSGTISVALIQLQYSRRAGDWPMVLMVGALLFTLGRGLRRALRPGNHAYIAPHVLWLFGGGILLWMIYRQRPGLPENNPLRIHFWLPLAVATLFHVRGLTLMNKANKQRRFPRAGSKIAVRENTR